MIIPVEFFLYITERVNTTAVLKFSLFLTSTIYRIHSTTVVDDSVMLDIC